MFINFFLIFLFLQGNFIWLTEMSAATSAWYVLFLLIIAVVVLLLKQM